MAIRLLKGLLKQCSPKALYRGRFSPIGLDIGSSYIKLIQLTQTDGAPAVYRYAAVPIPQGYLEGGKNGDPAILSDALKGIIEKTGFRSSRVQLSLPSQVVTLRRLTLPLLYPAEVAKAIRWEAEKHLPLPADETVFDYAFLERRTVEDKTILDFMLAAAPKAVARRCTETVLKAGLYPQGLDIALFALRRAMIWCGAIKPRPCLVVHIGAECSDLLILHHERYRFYRPLNIGTNHFSRDTAVEKQIMEPAKELCSLNLTGAAVKLAQQIARSLEFYAYETEHVDKHCAAVLLCGGGAMIPGLASFLQEELGIEISLFNPLAPPTLKTCDSSGDAAAATGLLYPIAIGLALRGWIR